MGYIYKSFDFKENRGNRGKTAAKTEKDNKGIKFA